MLMRWAIVAVIFREYWDIIYSVNHMQGGFIWDWVDQGMNAKDASGKFYYTYCGDLGGYHLHNDENFCCNGIIAADRTVHPGAYEVKKVYQDIDFKLKDLAKGIITVVNRFNFTNLDQYNYKWQLYKNGEKLKEGLFSVNAAPHTEKEVILSLPDIKADGVDEYYLNLQAATKIATDVIPLNYDIAT